jgi:hypothetical protein
MKFHGKEVSMFKVKKGIWIFFSFMFGSQAFGWGAKGHQIIAYVGAQLATDGQAFWQANLEPMRTLSTVPDRVWKRSATKSQEAPNHFFQIDSYESDSNFDHIADFPSSYVEAIQKYTENTVVQNGTAPWRIRQLYHLALQSLRAGDMKTGLQYVGTLSHYVGDISQPLHVSENYDGQKSGNKGIHAYFETTIINNEMQIRDEVKIRAQRLLKAATFRRLFEGQLMNVILQEVERSIAYRDAILKNDDQYGRNPKGAAVQLDLAEDRMADGAATLTLILNRLWQDSGLVAHATPMTIQDPSFVQPDFSQLTFVREAPYYKAIHAEADPSLEDCSLR